MNEFILVKNQDNNGHLMLRVASIRGAEDDFMDDGKPDGCTIWYENEENCCSASTAAEVLAAIHEAQGLVPRRGGLGTRAMQAYREQDAARFAYYSEGELPTRNTILAGPSLSPFLERLAPDAQSKAAMEKLGILTHSITETRAQVGSCVCPHHQGDNPACPVHGEGTAWGLLHGDK